MLYDNINWIWIIIELLPIIIIFENIIIIDLSFNIIKFKNPIINELCIITIKMDSSFKYFIQII